MLIEKTRITITIRRVGDVYILDISRQLTLGEGALNLEEMIKQIVEEGGKKIILNFSNTIIIDSSGIGVMGSVFTNISNLGGSLKLLRLNKGVIRLLKAAKFDTLFEIFDDEAKAVKSFR